MSGFKGLTLALCDDVLGFVNFRDTRQLVACSKETYEGLLFCKSAVSGTTARDIGPCGRGCLVDVLRLVSRIGRSGCARCDAC